MKPASSPQPSGVVLMLPQALRERVTNCDKAIVDVLAWPNPVERLAALTIVEASAFCAVYQATHELPAQLACGATSEVTA